MAKQSLLKIKTSGRGLHSITSSIEEALDDLGAGSIGVANLFLQHTSASLLIQENADPTARLDLQEFLERLAPEGESWHRHLFEGPDDTVSHLRAAVLPTSLTIPVANGKLAIGTWQGIYVFEHRRAPHDRKILITLME